MDPLLRYQRENHLKAYIFGDFPPISRCWNGALWHLGGFSVQSDLDKSGRFWTALVT